MSSNFDFLDRFKRFSLCVNLAYLLATVSYLKSFFNDLTRCAFHSFELSSLPTPAKLLSTKLLYLAPFQYERIGRTPHGLNLRFCKFRKLAS